MMNDPVRNRIFYRDLLIKLSKCKEKEITNFSILMLIDFFKDFQEKQHFFFFFIGILLFYPSSSMITEDFS